MCESADYVKDNYSYNPKTVNVYIHDKSVPNTGLNAYTGNIHFQNTDGDYRRSTAIHEYGHAIHYQHGANILYPNKKMAEGWAYYFESLFKEGALEKNHDFCVWKATYDYDHSWGKVYGEIFIDLYDGIDDSDKDFYENGELRIWQMFMDRKVKNIDNFYDEFTKTLSFEDKRAVRTIYATKIILNLLTPYG